MKRLFSVIPAQALHRMVYRAQAGIQFFRVVGSPLDSRFHGNDDSLRIHQSLGEEDS